jgi:alkylation response protein AidB-like acyl-CoA dehydrogenase
MRVTVPEASLQYAQQYPKLSTEAEGVAMPASRLLPSAEAEEFLAVLRDIVASELQPVAATFESESRFPRDVFRMLGSLGLLGLPYPERYDGGDQPYDVYLQCLEEIGAVWASVAVGVSVHVLSCFPLAKYGTEAQKERWLPAMIGGDLLGAYCLSEPHAGSDPAAMITRAVRDGDSYRISGAKAWTTHGGEADFYTVMARTSSGAKGISCFHVPADLPGIVAGPPEHKMGLTGSRTSTISFDVTPVPAENLIGQEGDGLAIALAALDSGRLGISAVATGLSQGALDLAVAYARERETFGRPIIQHQGLGFLLADMATAVVTSRATYLAAARRKDLGLPFSTEASIAKVTATDNAMRVTTDAVQVLGGAGYTTDFPAERFMRDAKIMQIFEGTNQIQRMIISRALDRAS